MRFALEPGHTFGIFGALRQHLDRDFAIQFRIARMIHRAHAARAKLRSDFVTTKICTGRNGHICGTAEGAFENRSCKWIERLILAALSWAR